MPSTSTTTVRPRRRPNSRRPSYNPIDNRPSNADESGHQIFDPSKNVLYLIETEKRHAEELQDLNDRLRGAELLTIDAKLAHQSAIIDLNSDMSKMRHEAGKELSACRNECQKEVNDLRARHTEDMAVAESSRLNSIRTIDAQQVQATATQANLAIQTLESTTRATAETLRATVASSAQAIAAQFSTTVTRMEDRIRLIEQIQASGAGRSAITDPALTELVAEVRRLAAARDDATGRAAVTDPALIAMLAEVRDLAKVNAETRGKTQGLSTAGGILLGVFGGIMALVAMGSFMFALTRGAQPQVPSAPSVYAQPTR